MSVERKGKFVVFEGNDGSGKTTMVGKLGEYLSSLGLNVVTTREPGGIEETFPLRQLLFDSRMKCDGMAQLLLFSADRRVHLLFQVIPALEEGKLVISDRFYGSMIVYQEEAGIPKEVIREINDYAITFQRERIDPDVTILLDVSAERGMLRRLGGGDINHFDEAKIEKQSARRQAFLDLAREFDWCVIDTTDLSPHEVFGVVVNALRRKGIIPEETYGYGVVNP